MSHKIIINILQNNNLKIILCIIMIEQIIPKNNCDIQCYFQIIDNRSIYIYIYTF